MDFGPLITALAAVLGKLEPIMVVMISMIAACGYYHVIWRREDREDREKSLEVIGKQTEAINGLRSVLSAITGKAQ